MKAVINKKNLKLALILALAALMTACGSKQETSSTDLSSRDPVTDNGSQTSNKALAVCNKISGSTISAQMKAGTNSSSQYIYSQVLLKLTALPANFESSSEYLNLWRWMANSANSTYLDPTPLTFYLYDTWTNKAVTGNKNSLKWSDVSTGASALGITDPVTYFARVILVVDVRDANGEYDVLKIASYNVSTNTTASQVDALLPLFYANPTDYAYESSGASRASVLQNLHPLKSMISQGWTTSQYQSMANSYCF